jgi:hypothetical protein
MPFIERDFRIEVLKSLWEQGAERYKENIRINSLLEDKAQKTAGMAGVFLAAALAFIKVDTLSQWPFNRLSILIILAIAIALLVSSIGFCLAVLWVRAITGPPTFEALNQLKVNLWAVASGLDLYEEGYWGDRAQLWQNVVDEQIPLIRSKAARLFLGQATLACAMFIAALLLLMLLGPVICSHLR